MEGAAASPPSFPRKRESGGGWAAKGWSFQYRGDSRLRGNDGRGDRRPSTVGIPAYAGRTVGRRPPLYRRDSRLRGNDGRKGVRDWGQSGGPESR